MQADPQALTERELGYRVWCVVGPETETSALSWDPPEPSEYGHDAVYVSALTRGHAIKAGVRAFRAIGAAYLDDGENPYKGVTAEDMTCRHDTIPWHLVTGAATDPLDDYETGCPACTDELESEWRATSHAITAGFWEY